MHRVSASNLRRRPPSAVKHAGDDGAERAHVLSLHLASRLWRHVHGHQFISSRDLEALKALLNRKENFEMTCAFANRVLHVNYDKEIMEAVLKEGKSAISPAAEMRLKKVINVFLLQIREEDARLKKFANKSVVILSKLVK